MQPAEKASLQAVKRIKSLGAQTKWSVGVLERSIGVFGLEPITPPLQYSSPDEAILSEPYDDAQAVGQCMVFH